DRQRKFSFTGSNFAISLSCSFPSLLLSNIWSSVSVYSMSLSSSTDSFLASFK
ncbi:hypothetical protein X975_01307, partial [Stegodyphus mimosarum]